MLTSKLEFLDILQEALSLPFNSIRFIIFSALTSFPFFCFSLFFNLTLQQSVLQIYASLWHSQQIQTAFSKLVQLGLLYLVPYHLLQFLSVATTVDMATRLYDGENLSGSNLRDFLRRPLCRNGIKGPFITFMYSVLLSASTLLGLLWIAANCFFVIKLFDNPFHHYYYYDHDYYYYGSGVSLLRNSAIIGVHGVAFVALLSKYVEWSGGWNASVVVSILGEEYGNEAFEVSAYFTRGSQFRGGMLMFVFFAWGVVLRLPCLFGGWSVVGNHVGFLLAFLGTVLICVGNVIKWVVCAVYFFDCKRRILEKKIDGEHV
ncbi:unnamed protein product [Linum tenue]|uniref:Transmembrane protein n=2 Tax=Linum tenue TaxID=586396 RepID=A0AAV0S2V3_9ROSI|nr:unnamed protein product [Linum tenue]